jgi:hypothetical protein
VAYRGPAAFLGSGGTLPVGVLLLAIFPRRLEAVWIFDPGVTVFLAAVLALDLIQLTGLTHEKIDISPSSVVSLRHPPAPRQGHFSSGVRCLIYTSDGKYIAVLEECTEVRKLLVGASKPAS